MKRLMFVGILGIAGVGLLTGAFYTGYHYREIRYFCLQREMEYSSESARTLLLRCRLELPEEVRALNVFSYDLGPDTECWFTCKVTPDERDALLKQWNRPADGHASSLPPPRTIHGPRPLDWWNPPQNLQEAAFEQLQTGYDPVSGTLYGYVFTI